MTPSPAEMTIRPQTSARRGRYGPEQPDDPAEVRLADGGVCRALRRLAGHEGVEAATRHEIECA